MKSFTINDLRNWGPCYDPAMHLAEEWSGTALDILKHKTIPDKDKLWVVLRREILDDKTLRLFAVSCAYQVQHFTKEKRSLRALDVAKRYANGKATIAELNAACADALAADAAAALAADAADARSADAAWAAANATRAAQVAKLIEMLEGLENE